MSNYFVDFMICDFMEFLKTQNNKKNQRGEEKWKKRDI